MALKAMEKKDDGKIVLEIEVPVREVEQALDRAYHRIARDIAIPGFRPGKAPRKMVEMRFGKEIFYEEAQKDLINDYYLKAIDEAKIKPISHELAEVKMEEGKPFVFKVEVEKEPEVELPEYRGIEVRVPDISVTDEEVESNLQDLRQRYARLKIALGRPAKKGDFVMIDYEGKIEGKPVEGVKAENEYIELGANDRIPGFDDAITGMSIGEEKVFQVKFPEDYGNKKLDGKEVEFTVKLKEIKEKELPELNDEFASEVGECESLAELKEAIRKKILEFKKSRQEHEIRSQVYERILENTVLDIPQKMIDREISKMMDELEMNLKRSRVTLDDYFRTLNVTREEYIKKNTPSILKRIKSRLILEAIIKKENIIPAPEEITAKIEEMALAMGRNPKALRKELEKKGTLRYIAEQVAEEKAERLLIDSAKIIHIDEETSSRHEHGPECGCGDRVKTTDT